MIQQPSSTVVVKLIEPAKDPTGLADVLLGSLGLTGILALGAILLGVVLACLMFWVRSRAPFDH